MDSNIERQVSARLVFMIYEGQNSRLMIPLLTATDKLQETFCHFQKGHCKNWLFLFFFFFIATVTGDVLQTPPKQLESWQFSACCAFQVRERQRDGTTAACFSFRHQYLTYRCHPRKTRHSKQTRIHAHAHMTSVSRSRLSELKPGRATWVVVTLYLITFSPGCF